MPSAKCRSYCSNFAVSKQIQYEMEREIRSLQCSLEMSTLHHNNGSTQYDSHGKVIGADLPYAQITINDSLCFKLQKYEVAPDDNCS